MGDCNKARKELNLTRDCCTGCHEDFDLGYITNLCTIIANGKSYEVCCDLRDEFSKRQQVAKRTDTEYASSLRNVLRTLLQQAYLAGFNVTGEGHNAEYPYEQKDLEPKDDPDWCKRRDDAIKSIMGETTTPDGWWEVESGQPVWRRK